MGKKQDASGTLYALAHRRSTAHERGQSPADCRDSRAPKWTTIPEHPLSRTSVAHARLPEDTPAKKGRHDNMGGRARWGRYQPNLAHQFHEAVLGDRAYLKSGKTKDGKDAPEEKPDRVFVSALVEDDQGGFQSRRTWNWLGDDGRDWVDALISGRRRGLTQARGTPTCVGERSRSDSCPRRDLLLPPPSHATRRLGTRAEALEPASEERVPRRRSRRRRRTSRAHQTPLRESAPLTVPSDLATGSSPGRLGRASRAPRAGVASLIVSSDEQHSPKGHRSREDRPSGIDLGLRSGTR